MKFIIDIPGDAPQTFAHKRVLRFGAIPIRAGLDVPQDVNMHGHDAGGDSS